MLVILEAAISKFGIYKTITHQQLSMIWEAISMTLADVSVMGAEWAQKRMSGVDFFFGLW